MKKSQCFRACKYKNNEIVFMPTESFLDVITDSEGNKFNIHFHKIGGYWSATEESTGLRCSRGTHRTRQLCYENVLEYRDAYSWILALESSVDLARKLKEYKESL